MNRFSSLLISFLFLAVSTIVAFAGLPQTISYQGYVKNGTVPVNGLTSMTFSLYSSNPVRNDNYVWRETQPAVTVSNGIYSTQLGSTTPITAPFDVPYYLGVNIANTGELPLQPLSSVPYALRAATADSLSGVQPVSLPSSGLTVGTNQLAVTNDGVGINKSNPTAALDVSGNAAVSGNLSFGTTARQMLNLFGSNYGIGVQDYALYFRTDGNGGFAWHKGGTHSNTANDPGTGGTGLMTLDASGNLNAAGQVRGNNTDGVSVYGVNASTDKPPVEAWNQGSGDLFRGWSGSGSPSLKFSVTNNGTVKGTSFIGNGSGLTNVTAKAAESIVGSGGAVITVDGQTVLHVFTSFGGFGPNISLGHPGNVAGANLEEFSVGSGATVSGGGYNANTCWDSETQTSTKSCLNTTTTSFTTIGGGAGNTATNYYSTVGGGNSNTASGLDSIVGGGFGNTASGRGSTVGGGYSNLAGGDFSFAAGIRAKVRDAAMVGSGTTGDQGTFVWADSQTANFISTGQNQFLIRAAGGIGINKNNPAPGTLDVSGNAIVSGSISAASASLAGNMSVGGDTTVSGYLSFGATTRQMLNLWGTGYGLGVQDFTLYFRTDSDFTWYKKGVHSDVQGAPGTGGSYLMGLSSSGLAVNGTFVSASDRNAKENFAEVDPASILQKVADLPLSTWNYREDDKKVRHIGPMAQDFYASFGVGPDDKHITTVDADGIALAAIKALKAENDALKARLEKIEQLLSGK